MPISGPQALRSLDDAVRDIRSEERDISARVARSGERVAKIREAEADLFRQLAGFRLTTATRDEALGPLTLAEKRARDMLKQHAKDIAGLDRKLKRLDAAIADQARKRRAVVDHIDAHQADLKALSSQIAQEIAKDPDYVSKREAVEHLHAVATQSLQKTAQAEQAREQKGKPYRDDPLFMYLWEAGYGTRHYKAGNIARWIDAKIARMVRFIEARPNFSMLNDIPLRLGEHADRQAQLAREAEDALDVLELSAVDAAGGKPMRTALSDAQSGLENIDAEMVRLEDDRDEQARAHRHLAEGRDPAFEKATNMLAQSLESASLSRLLIEARLTPTSADDSIVKKIEDARNRIAEEEVENAEHKARLKLLATRRRELEDIEFDFKKARYDDPRSVFREDGLAGDLLNEFLRGAITAATYWNQWQRSQSWRPGTSDWGGGIGLPRSGRNTGRISSSVWPKSGGSISPWGRAPGRSSGSSSSGGFTRPRTRSRSGSRGARKHGGFKTGGGF